MRIFKSHAKRLASLSAAAFFVLGAAALETACVSSVPIEEFTLARSAYDSAKDADAARYAPGLWFNCEQAYREGQKAFKDRRYSEARDKFEDTKSFAEQAENVARVTRHQSGDIAP